MIQFTLMSSIYTKGGVHDALAIYKNSTDSCSCSSPASLNTNFQNFSMADPFKLKDAPIPELQAAVRAIVGIDNGHTIERVLWAFGRLSEPSRQSRQHLRRLLHTLARDNDQAKEGLERLSLMPKDPNRVVWKMEEALKVQEQREAEKRKRDVEK